MEWKIAYIKEAVKDLRKLDAYNRKLVLKAIQKTAQRPLPPPEGVGKPLGNHASTRLGEGSRTQDSGSAEKPITAKASSGGLFETGLDI